MILNTILRGIVLSTIILFSTSAALAAPVFWTDWTSATNGTPSSALGTLNIGPSTVDVSFSGSVPYSFVQTSGGTNYWNPSTPYLSATVGNAPPASDIIALNTGGTATITFSSPVQDPLLALVSWNSNTVDFGVPIEILSYGAGYWGNGTPILNAGGTGFYGSGEVHGVIELPGSFTSMTFTHTSEGWHGFTVGVFGLGDGEQPPSSVPEPATLLLLGSGLVGIIGFRRKFKK